MKELSIRGQYTRVISRLKKKGHRAGEPFSAQCSIAERDEHHVIAKYNVEGVTKPGQNLIHGGAIPPAGREIIYGGAKLTVIYVRSPAK